MNSKTFPRFFKHGVCWEDAGLPAHRRAEETFVLTSLAEACVPPSPPPPRSSECLCGLGISGD